MITNIDLSVLRFMEQIHNPVTDFFFSVITFLGDGGIIWIGSGLILLFIPKHRKTGIMVLAGLVVFHLICNTGLKNIIARPRPYVLVPEFLGSMPDINVPTSYSMPSGHTMSAFVCAEILAGDFKRYKAPLYVTAVFMGLSRIYLLVHYPSDVIVGALLGIMLGKAVKYTADKYYKTKKPL